MKTEFITAKIQLTDAKETKSQRRFRHILANSGEIMESGEIRELDQLYVMDRDGKLIKISDLNTNPDEQTEDYAVKAQADHGELVDGEFVPSMEKQFGSCKVWIEDDGLHARMYFADNDALADHAWAISEDASYSTGIDWYPDGYYGTGYEIEEPIGILREISMVLTGNDPRAKTIDSKSGKAKGVAKAAKSADGETNSNKETAMSKKLDELTPDERDAFMQRIGEVVNDFTTTAPESETEPTARDTKDDVDGEPAEAPAEPEAPAKEATEPKEEPADTKSNEEVKDTLHMPVTVIKTADTAKQETAAKTRDWLYSAEAKQKFADVLKAHGSMDAAFAADWRKEASKHVSLDGISGLPVPVNVEQIFEVALEKSDGIISHFRNINSKSFRINLLAAASDDAGRAAGFVKGSTKSNQELNDVYRDLLNIMVYKKLDLDAMEMYENPELIDIRVEELMDAIILEIERAAIISDGRTAPSGQNPDRRMFNNNRGFYSVKADAAAASGIGQLLTSTVAGNVGTNLYDKVVAAKGAIKAEGRQFIVAKSSVITALLQARADGTTGQYLLTPGSSIEDFLGVERVYTPAWMENDTDNDAYLLVDGAYAMIGERGIRTRSEFDTTTNTDVLLAETPRGGSLYRYKSAVAIATAATSGE